MQPRDPSGLRISDEDRHKVAEVLRQAAGEGRIDLGELDERLEAAYSAKTYADLVPITADLPINAQPVMPVRPAGAQVPAASYPSSFAVMSETKRTGVWNVEAENSAFALMGNVTLDMREAQFLTHEVVVTACAIMAEVKVIVNAETIVVVDGVGIMGEFKEQRARVDPDLSPASPVVRIRGMALMGSVNVQRKGTPGAYRRRIGWSGR